MLSFKNLKGMDGIDKLTECAALIDEIFSDEEIFNKKTNATFGELATPIYKKHTKTVNRLFEILGEKPESAVSILSNLAVLLTEAANSPEVCSFFMSTAKSLNKFMLAMVNTEGEQSADT
jgi:hypothetical protein